MKGIIYSLFGILTGAIGYHMHHNVFWAIIDFIFAPLVWIKWIMCQEIHWSIVKATLDSYFN